MKTKGFLCAMCAALGGAAEFFWGPFSYDLASLMVFMAIDYIMGIIVAAVFKKSPKEYIKFSIGKVVVAVVVMAITGIIVNCLPSIGVFWLVIRLCIVILISNFLLVVIYFKNKYFKETIKLAKKMIFK